SVHLLPGQDVVRTAIGLVAVFSLLPILTKRFGEATSADSGTRCVREVGVRQSIDRSSVVAAIDGNHVRVTPGIHEGPHIDRLALTVGSSRSGEAGPGAG